MHAVAKTEEGFVAMMDQTHFLYDDKNLPLPSAEDLADYMWALWTDQPEQLLQGLKKIGFLPWEIIFVEDGLGDDSPNKIGMVKFAANKGSWACVAKLVEFCIESGFEVVAKVSMGAALAEYESALDPERVEFLERYLSILNQVMVGAQVKHIDFEKSFMPLVLNDFPKGSRFLVKDLASLQFVKRKGANPIFLKRCELRQKMFLAICDGNCAEVANVFNALNANSLAHMAATRKVWMAVSPAESDQFVKVAMACRQPACVKTLLEKTTEYAKSIWRSKLTRKDMDEDERLAVKGEMEKMMLMGALLIARSVDSRQHSQKCLVDPIIENALESVIYAVLLKSENPECMEAAKNQAADAFDVEPCLTRAINRAQAGREKADIVDFMEAEAERPVQAPRERERERARL